MASSSGRRALRAAAGRVFRPALLTGAACAIALAGCDQSQQTVSIAQPRGATVAFESIDGLPPAQFDKLVQGLNDEAQSRRLAVISREQPSAYRVRGYLAAEVENDKTTISWVWDVFDGGYHRALRIDGAETANHRPGDAWQAADEAMLRRIAHDSMDKLTAFLTSPDVAPGTPGPAGPAGDTQMALAATPASSPEAAGIFRIFHPQADPLHTDANDIPAAAAAADDSAVPLPRRRPAPRVAGSEGKTVALAASRRAGL